MLCDIDIYTSVDDCSVRDMCVYKIKHLYVHFVDYNISLHVQHCMYSNILLDVF